MGFRHQQRVGVTSWRLEVNKIVLRMVRRESFSVLLGKISRELGIARGKTLWGIIWN